MKNGINLAGISEAAHEMRDKLEEAQFIYRGFAHWGATKPFSARVGTVTMGTCRAARDFRIQCASADRGVGEPLAIELLTAVEMALLGVGACMLTTVVLGSSSKSQTLVDTALLLSQAGHGPSWGVSYEVFVGGDMESQALLETMHEASSHSPNHRTLVEGNTVSWSLHEPAPHAARKNDILIGPRDVAVAREAWPFADEHAWAPGVRHLPIRWDYGVQLSVWPDAETGAVGRFPIDQPKQFGGMDRGPNPQEYLLSALAASVVETALGLARARDIDVHEAACHTSGRVDGQGLLGLDPSVPVKVQDISCALSFRGPVTPDEQAALAKEAVATAEVARLLTTPQPVHMTVVHNGEKLRELTSSPWPG